MGKWKALRKDMHNGNLEWELYDLESDPAENKDVSSEHPELIAEVEEIVAREHTIPDNNNWRYEFYTPITKD